MNSRQRRTVARAKDRRAPYGAAALRRERRKGKRVVSASSLDPGMSDAAIAAYNALEPIEWDQLASRPGVKIGWRQDRFIKAVRDAFWDAANPLRYPAGVTWREVVTAPETSEESRHTGNCSFRVDIREGNRICDFGFSWKVGDDANGVIGDARMAGGIFRRKLADMLDEPRLRHEVRDGEAQIL